MFFYSPLFNVCPRGFVLFCRHVLYSLWATTTTHLTELQSFDETMFTNLFETRGMKDELYPESLSSVPTSLDLSNILEWMCKEIDEPMMKTLGEKERTALG